MRCLNCGTPLSAFKKLTDSDFCSAEHRDAFHTAQQKLIVARLRESAEQFRRVRRGVAPPDAPRLVPPKIEEAPAPAGIAAFHSEPPAYLDRPFTADFTLEFIHSGIGLAFPVRASASRKTGLLAALLLDWPWPRYNPGLLGSIEHAEPEVQPHLGDAFTRHWTLRGSLTSIGGIKWQGVPDIGDGLSRRTFPLRILRPKPAIAMQSLRASRTGLGQALKLRRSLPLDRIDAAAVAAQQPILLEPAHIRGESAAAVQPRHEIHGKAGMSFLDRVYRMRPRAGVLSPRVSTIQVVPPLPLAYGSAIPPVRGLDLKAGPVQIQRFFRPRPRGPMDDEAMPRFRHLPSDFVGFVSEIIPTAPSAASRRPQLQVKSRFLRMSLRPLQSEVVTEGNTGEALCVSWSGKGSKPQLAGLPTTQCEPARVERLWDIRSGEAIAANMAAFESIDTDVLDSMVAPALRDLQRLAFDFEPSASARLFRMRPRAGVPGVSADVAIPVTAPEQLISDPAAPATQTTIDAAPELVTRMFRMRPRAGVDRVTKQLESPIPSALPTARQTAETPSGFTPNLSARLSRLDHLFRLWPRPAAARDESFAMPQTLSVESPAATPALGKLPVADVGGFEPRPTSRMYRGRPRAGIMSDRARSMMSIPVEACAFNPKPAVRHIGLADLEPSSAPRFYRFRPKTAADRGTAPQPESAQCVEFPATRRTWRPDWWDGGNVTPPFLNRMYRMRIKRPAQDIRTLAMSIRSKQLPTPDPEPVIAGMPPELIEAGFGLFDRLYRMRPRGGRTVEPGAEQIPCREIEPRSPSGTPTTVLDSVSRRWKASPLPIKAISIALPALLLVALFSFGTEPTVERARKAEVPAHTVRMIRL